MILTSITLQINCTLLLAHTTTLGPIFLCLLLNFVYKCDNRCCSIFRLDHFFYIPTTILFLLICKIATRNSVKHSLLSPTRDVGNSGVVCCVLCAFFRADITLRNSCKNILICECG